MAMDWQPIETAPKDGTLILGFGPGVDGWTWPVGKPMPQQFSVTRWTEHEIEQDEEIEPGLFRKVKVKALGGWRGTSLSWFTPTHWMPLPKPPEAT